MKKREFIKKISEEAGLEKEDAEEFYFMFFKCIIDALKKREKVKIKGFGTFLVKKEVKIKKGKKKKEEIKILFKPLGRLLKL